MPAIFLKSRVIKKGRNSIESMHAMLERIEKDMGPQLRDVANSTYHHIDDYINLKRKRRKNPYKLRLSSAFKEPVIKYELHKIIMGIGDERNLDANFPYWKILEWGGRITSGSVPGWFGRVAPPNQFSRFEKTETFHYHPYTRGNFLMTPDALIEGIKYLREARRWLNRNWSEIWKNYYQRQHYKSKPAKFDVPTARFSKATKELIPHFENYK